jgi:alkylhydroperoxidase family enzyme
MMIREMIDKLIDSQEEKLGASLDYLREMADQSLSVFFKFSLFTPMSEHHKVVPPAALHLARIISSRAEDCGTCVQIGVNMALEDDVPPEYIRPALTDRRADLPPFLQDIYDYATAVVNQREVEPELRERIRIEVGDEGIVELSVAIASAQVYPIVKRGMGYSKSCRLIDVDLDGQPVSTGKPPQRLAENETVETAANW